LKNFLAFTLVAGTLVACGSTPPKAAPAPTALAIVAATEQMPEGKTAAPVATIVELAPAPTEPAELATLAPTEEMTAQPATAMPAAVATVPSLMGVAASGSDCPADHPVKGNIVDRGANKGDKIYHMPGSSSYKQTKPERCFLDAKEAEAAGFRAPK
jgi:hypothetical protein